MNPKVVDSEREDDGPPKVGERRCALAALTAGPIERLGRLRLEATPHLARWPFPS